MASKISHTYGLTEAQIETMAHERTQGQLALDSTDGTFLRVLVFHTQGKLGAKRGRAPGKEAQLTALETIAQPFYAAVLRGVTTPEIAIDATTDPAQQRLHTIERNRRATFARTAKSTLVAWVNEGGDLRALEVATVTKGELRRSVQAARLERGVPDANAVERGQATILAAVAREGPDKAREHLEAVISALQDALEQLPSEALHDTTTIRTRVGTPSFRGAPAPMLHRGA